MDARVSLTGQPPDMLSPEHILRTGFGFCASKTLLSAVELGVFTELGKGPRSGRQLRRSLGLNERAAPDLLDALVALGLLEREGNDSGAVYMNTRETGHFLDRNSPGYLGELLERANLRLYSAWGELGQALRPGGGRGSMDPPSEPAYPLADSLIAASARTLADRFDFTHHRTLAEAGAPGELSRHLAARHAHLRCTTLQLPAEWARRPPGGNEQAPGPSEQSSAVPRADVIVMTMLLRRYDLGRKRALIQHAYEALPAGGCLIALENLIDDERRHNAFGLLMSLNVLLELGGGFDFTAADFDGWCRDAGFARTEVLSLVWPVSAAVAYK